MSKKYFLDKEKQVKAALEKRNMSITQDNIESGYKIILNGIMEQCDGFYQTFQKLNNKSYFGLNWDDIGWDKWLDQEKFFSPCVVNGAFATEMALKYLILCEGTKVECTHNLHVLFNYLSDTDKTALSDKLDAYSSYYKNDLDTTIKNLANTFVEWRYTFELNDHGISVFFMKFVEIICNYAIDKYNNNKKELGGA